LCGLNQEQNTNPQGVMSMSDVCRKKSTLTSYKITTIASNKLRMKNPTLTSYKIIYIISNCSSMCCYHVLR